MDSRSRRDGAAIEELGWYNPINVEHSFSLNEERIIHWLKDGAQTTDAAHKLLRRAGISYKWHLINQGLDDSQLEIEMQKWNLNHAEVLKARSIKKENADANTKKNEKNTVSAEEEE